MSGDGEVSEETSPTDDELLELPVTSMGFRKPTKGAGKPQYRQRCTHDEETASQRPHPQLLLRQEMANR